MSNSTLLYGKTGGPNGENVPLLVDEQGRVVFQGGGGGGGTGDMSTAVYDPDQDGKVESAVRADTAASADTATSVPWTAITGEPTSFTPAAHAATHKTGGADQIRLNELAVPTGMVDFNQMVIKAFTGFTGTSSAGVSFNSSHNGMIVFVTGAGLGTGTLPAVGSVPTGWNTMVIQGGDGQFQFSGTPIVSADGKTKTRTKGSPASVVYWNGSYYLFGDLA